MAAETQTGNAKLYGITNNGTPFIVGGFATLVMQTAKLDNEFELQADKDNNNADNTLIATNNMIKGTLEFEPSGATRTAAAAVAAFLSPLASVVLQNFKLAALNGTWIYTGGQSISLAFNASAKISLPVRQYTDTAQNSSLSTPVTG